MDLRVLNPSLYKGLQEVSFTQNRQHMKCLYNSVSIAEHVFNYVSNLLQ